MCSPGESLERSPIRPNQELLKVPSNVSPLDWGPDDELWVSKTGPLATRVGRNMKSCVILTWGSEGVGRLFFRKVKKGSSFSPLTSTSNKTFPEMKVNNQFTLLKISALGTNPLPGRTFCRALRISTPSEFS